jgi:ABC-2 type transport system ATP-binding protein
VAQIVVENLIKTFQVAEREAGLWGAIRGLARRRYRTVRALDGISFSLETGELVGYIGPNGAGKSTTVKTLAGILVPDSGRCEILRRVPWKERVAHVRSIGVVFGQRTQLWWDLPVIESFDLLRDIYRVPPADYARARDELACLLNLEPLLDVPVRQLSLGQRMRCDLAAALLHAPALLFLDEPTIGLDAVSKLAVRDFVRRLNRERGVTVILTTHDMDDIEALCTRVILIGEGRILSDGTLEALRGRVTNERWLIVDLEDEREPVGDPEAEIIRRDGHRVCLRFDPARISPAALIGRITANHAISDLFVQNPPIEEIIARLYREPAPRPPIPGESANALPSVPPESEARAQEGVNSPFSGPDP